LGFFSFGGDGISGDVWSGWLSVENERIGCLATGTPSSSFPYFIGKGFAQGRFDFSGDLSNPSNPAIVS